MRKIFLSRPTLSALEGKEVLDTLSSGWLTSGPKAARFEKMLSDYLGCPFVRVVNSCTSALHLAVLSCGIHEGDEVITTPFTFCATVNAIINSGAKPVFADIDKDTFNIDPDRIRTKITRRTKAILVMHYAGLPCDMSAIMRIARKYNLKVIEDAAHAIGAEYKGKKIGTISDVTCFSFHAAKNMTTGEGGAITARSPTMKKFIEKALFYGIDKPAWQRHKKGSWQYRVIYPGFKYNLSDILACLGIHQLKKLNIFMRKRARIASLYTQAFRGNSCIQLQHCSYRAKHARYLYPIVLDRAKLGISRDRFIKELKKRRIFASVHFIPIYKHPAYKALFTERDIGQLRNTEWVYRGILSLPIYPLLPLKDVRYVISTINKLTENHRR
jgi:dTDP-4-amino-4,6-dideoxygalactose transaminase